MTQEEKAKAYDEVLKKIQPLYEQAKKDDNPIWSTYEHLFPQLHESEDERLRKHIVKFIDEQYPTHGNLKEEKDKMLAYLEKLKEQKPVDYEAELKKCKDNPLYFYDKYVSIKQKPAEWGAEHSCRSEMLKGFEETANEWYEKCQFLKSVWWNEEGKTKLIDAWESFIAGVKWQEEREPLPEDTVLWDDGFKTGREVGAMEQKERMMNEAIEATLDNTAYPTRLWFNTYLSEYSNNDKVRVIIVKDK